MSVNTIECASAKTTPTHSSRAYSLVEVLVVISLIVILASMLVVVAGPSIKEARKARWFSNAVNFQADADLLAYYAFMGEGEGNRVINQANSQAFNQGAEIDPRHFDLTLMKSLDTAGTPYENDEANALWVDGRWAGKYGIAFNKTRGKTDWAESRPHAGTVITSQDYSVMVTFGTFNGIGRDTGLLSVGNFYDGIKLDEKPWHLNAKPDNSTTFFNFRHYTEDLSDEEYESGNLKLVDKTYYQLIMSYSGREQKVTWYLNGKEIGSDTGVAKKLSVKPEMVPLIMAANFDPDTNDHRFFSGVIDEAALLLRAISAEEAQMIAENGNLWED